MKYNKLVAEKKFIKLISEIGKITISRKELIEKSKYKFKFNNDQAIRFISRNVHKLRKEELIKSLGVRNKIEYLISGELFYRIILSEKSNLLNLSYKNSNSAIEYDHAITEIKLQYTISEISTYIEYMEKSPEHKKYLQEMIEESRNESLKLYGRLQAIRRINHLKGATSHQHQVCEETNASSPHK